MSFPPFASTAVFTLLVYTALSPTSAHAQAPTYSYFSSNTTINTPVTTDLAIVGFSAGRYNPDTFAREFTGPASPTVTIAAGADIPDVEVFNSSIINMTGGTASVFPYDQSTVNIHGGSVPFAIGFESSVINVHGGLLDDLEGQCHRINVFDGTIGTLVANVQTDAAGNPLGICIVDISGGIITNELNAFNGGIFNLRGGQFLVPFAYAIDGAAINIFGSNLASELIDPNFISPGGNSYSVYSVSGLLSDGTALSDLTLRIKNDGSSSFTINNIPTPSAAGVLALGGLLAARRRRGVSGR